MSKNTTSSAFRKIDVDQYNDDYYKEEEGSEPHSPPTGPDEQEIQNLINQGKHIDAMKNLLRTAPTGTKNQCIKDAAFNLVLKVILSIKTSDIEKTVAQLDRDQIDMLMKYVYKGFENPSEGRSAHLLAWHEKVYAAGGMGSIVRVLTDKKHV
ncbi:actin-related protein 2/3 complex subunit 5-B isoform X1 [Parasteatoda tepidariorum]|uniref:actin-related protein 2/3 complex subunit 5-B isoform X1 n=1 Tax=Parasteatoda tepidariorum TaxID=114398 RepID=UPI00077FDD6E|nr:actin-related protein 2/3 complex subunit 5-B isoform X1 [Parasteatoda tepidariorum]